MKLRWTPSIIIVALALALGACTHPGFGSIEAHFATFKVPPPRGTTVTVCHAYGCQMQTRFRFTARARVVYCDSE